MKELKIYHAGINYLSKCHLKNSSCKLIALTFVLFDEAEAEIPTWKVPLLQGKATALSSKMRSRDADKTVPTLLRDFSSKLRAVIALMEFTGPCLISHTRD